MSYDVTVGSLPGVPQEIGWAVFCKRTRQEPDGCRTLLRICDGEPIAPKTNGYCEVKVSGQRWLAHRFAYELANGPIPTGMVLDHLCRNRACCEPSHLEPVTQAVNVHRGFSIQAANARKTECPHGHPFSPENTLHYRGRRVCRTCKRQHDKRRHSKAYTRSITKEKP